MLWRKTKFYSKRDGNCHQFDFNASYLLDEQVLHLGLSYFETKKYFTKQTRA